MLEPNRLYKGDCLELMKHIPAGSVDMILTDLPYGVSSCEWDKIIDIKKLWEQYNRIIKDNGVIALTASLKFALDLINANRKNFRYELIWKKPMPVGFANARRMPLRSHELILIFYKKAPVYNAQGLIEMEKPKECKRRVTEGTKNSIYRPTYLGKPYIRRYTNYPRSVLEFSNGNNFSVHPTQKPQPLFEYLIKTFTNEGDLVLDSCIGSGTTALACLATGRRFIGIEKDDRFYGMACKRVAEKYEGFLELTGKD